MVLPSSSLMGILNSLSSVPVYLIVGASIADSTPSTSSIFTCTSASTPKLAPVLKPTPAKNGAGPILKVWEKAALEASVAPTLPSMVS